MVQQVEIKRKNEADGLSYHLLRAALNRFSKVPAELSNDELAWTKAQAEREYKLEKTVLNSPEAGDVVIPQVVLEESVRQVSARYESEDDFLTDLASHHLDLEGLTDALHRELRVEAVLDRVSSRAADISDVDVMIYYYMHKDKFYQPETRTAYHILITVNDDYEENSRNNAIKRLNDIRKRVIKKPHRFEEQAQKHSECPTALQGGRIGRIPRGQLFPELDEVMFNLNEGAFSEIIESEVGLHLLYCQQIHKEGPASLKEATAKIKEHLLKRRRKMCQKSWLAALKQA